MTDKQIIIDGDVSGCEFLITSGDKQMCRCIKSDLFGAIEFVENARNGNCKDNPNCYYKQLKRKEQECEKLKIELENSIKLNKANAKSYEKFWYKVEAYKQTLSEIKEIAEENLQTNACANCDGKGIQEGCIDTDCSYYQMEKIYKKISGVNNEDN